VALLSVLTGCGDAKSPSGAAAEKGEPAGEYISFTVTNEAEGGMFESHVFCYDIASGKLGEKATVPYNSQYPLAVYDRSADKVFYSASADEGERVHTGDQLYSFDPETKKTERLTESLYAINYILPWKGKVLAVACPKDIESVTLLLYSWDKAGKSLSKLSWDDDANISQAYMRPDTGELTITTIPSAEDWERIGNQSEGNPYIPPDTSVFSVNAADGSHELLFKQKQEVQTVLSCGDDLIMKEKSYIKDGYSLLTPERILVRDSGGKDKGDWPYAEKLKGLKSLKSLVHISDDGGQVYYIAVGEGDSDTELRRYDVKSDKTEVIYAAKSGYSAINNAVALNN
jgi:hypothetical protein